MSDKKKDAPKPRVVPIVEDVDLPEETPGTGDRPKPSESAAKEPAPEAKTDPKKSEGARKQAKSAKKQPDVPENLPEPSENPPEPSEKGADPVEKPADSRKRRIWLFGKSGKADPAPEEAAESEDNPSPDNAAAEREAAITESGMIRKDDEIDRSIFEPEEGKVPGMIGFSPDTDVSAAALVGAGEDHALSFGDLEVKEEEESVKIVRRVKVRQKTERGASLRTLGFGICYLVVVIIAGIILGSQIVGIGNDMFAFTFETDTDGNPVSYTVVIEDEGMSAAEVGRLLEDAGAIKYDWVFKLYAQLKKKDSFKVKAGIYEVSAAANYDAIMSILNPVPQRQEVKITFTEGMNTDEIIDLFLENGIGTREGFERALNTYPYSYWFMDYLKAELPEGRFYRLDGYLYPDTYLFFSDTGEVAAIDKLLANFNKKFGEEYRTVCDELGMTPDEVVRLASMIEAEVRYSVDYITVSAVFHNRMVSADFAGLLQSDATVQYYFHHVEGARHEEITPEDLQVDTPYNTYLYAGLPPGAICNPSLTALKAALYPEEDCPYYYFVSRPNGFMYYARTLAEHNANIEKVREESENTTGGVGEYE